jgi:EpsI family protein
MPKDRRIPKIGYGLFLGACLLLALQAGASRMVTVDERNVPVPALAQLPQRVGNWTASNEQALEPDILESLRPDSYVLRDYVKDGGELSINLFVAYFKSLQNTYGPHSPKICLPGSGWLIHSSATIKMPVPGVAGGIPVNQYVMEKDNHRILVLYWYQNNRNVWADEFWAKIYLLPDLLRYRRSDVSLVRIIEPIRQPSPSASDLADSLQFTDLVYPKVVERLATAQ